MNAFDISVTFETSQYGITPYSEEIAYSVHSPVVGDSLRQAVMALEKVASVKGARHELGGPSFASSHEKVVLKSTA